ncbi:MAG: long-chain fatty acid--CoA ligase [Acidobacteria bacterium]|nr:long-chain fatty acid--CoA ligase [Acidobacteriota bacterium]
MATASLADQSQTYNTGQLSVYASKPWLENYDYWVPATINYAQSSLYQILALAASLQGDKVATAFLGAELTYDQIKRQADKLAAALSHIGIAKGDRVGLMLPNCPQYVISVFAILRLGAIVVNINPIYTLREVDLVANDSGMKALIAFDMVAPIGLGVKSNSQIETVIITSLLDYSANPSAANPAPAGALSFVEFLNGAGDAKPPSVDINAKEDIAILQYTGGTTGVPKGAMITHFNAFANVLQIHMWGREFHKLGEGRILMVIPLYHIYALTCGMLLGTWQAAMMILIPKYDVNMVLEAIQKYAPTYFPAVPTLFISLLNHPEAAKYGLDKVKRFNSGSAPLPVEVIEQFEHLSGAMVYEGYGLTEASPTTHSTPTLAKRKIGSIGLPITGTDCKIVDLETGDKEVPLGEDGELCIRGPQVMKGYWNKPEETALTLRDGWLYTGDIARMDADGFFYIVQRKKDMIIVSGFNVYPGEVEDVLFTHPAVMEAAVIGVADEYRGESVKAFVVLKADVQATVEELLQHCRERLAKFKIPASIEIIESLPKTNVGKVLRRVLRDQEEEKRRQTIITDE